MRVSSLAMDLKNSKIHFIHKIGVDHKNPVDFKRIIEIVKIRQIKMLSLEMLGSRNSLTRMIKSPDENKNVQKKNCEKKYEAISNFEHMLHDCLSY